MDWQKSMWLPCAQSTVCEMELCARWWWALFVTYTIIQNIMRSEMCSLHLTHPSAHTPGAVGSRHCGARGAVGGSVPCPRVSPQSWTLPARAGIRTHNLGLPRVSSPTLYPLGHDCPFRVSYLSHSAQIQIFHNISIFAMQRIWMRNYYLLWKW